MDRDTKLIAEYIFSQLAVNIMWYCRLKIAISL